jgi:hypothetical protein
LENNRAEQFLPGIRVRGKKAEAQTMYMYVSKCKNDKIKKKTQKYQEQQQLFKHSVGNYTINSIKL